jgi:DNA polymerase-1
VKFEVKLGVPSAEYVDSAEAIEAAIRRCFESKRISLKVETLGKSYGKLEDQILFMGLSPDRNTRLLVPRAKLHRFKCVLESEDITKVVHDYKFAAHRFANAGIQVKGPVLDTFIMDWLYDEETRQGKHGLASCALDYLGIQMDRWTDIIGKESPVDIKAGHAQWNRLLDHSTLGAWAVLMVFEVLEMELRAKYLDRSRTRTLMDIYWETEEPQVKSLYKIERRGFNIDAEYLRAFGEEIEKERGSLAAELCHIVGRSININSNRQIANYLYGERGLPVHSRTRSGAPSVDEKALTRLAQEGEKFCQVLNAYRKKERLKNNYVDGLLRHIQHDGRIHTELNPVAVTGRLTSREPNLQNIPVRSEEGRRIRYAFIGDIGHVLIVADYGQLEMRVLAHVSGDKDMCQGMRSGLDMHSFTGARMMKISVEEFLKRRASGDTATSEFRQAAKQVGFGIMYGMGIPALAAVLTERMGREVPEKEAQKFYDDYLTCFPAVAAKREWYQEHAKRRGYVQTFTGRFRNLSKARRSSRKERARAMRQAVNAPIQGGAHDIVKAAMQKCENSRKLKELGCTLRIQVHDEFGFSCPRETAEEAAVLIKKKMEDPLPYRLLVPLVTTPVIVDRWGEAK